MRLSFTKMHGLGNDFIVFEAPAGSELPPPDVVRRLANRRTGIGFDQALVLLPPRDESDVAQIVERAVALSWPTKSWRIT